MMKFLLSLTTISLLSTHCVQIPLGNSKPKSYKKVDFKAPKDFSPLKASSSDQAWIQNQSGNIISYRSECPTEVRNLQSFSENLRTDFTNEKLVTEKNFRFNNREAVRQSFTAEIESIKTAFDLVVFKKYGCLFIITHNGTLEALNKTADDFESFLSSFKVTQ